MRIKFFLSNNIDLFHFGRTLAGLYALPDTDITLHRVNWITNPLCAAIEVEKLKLGIEVSDHSNFWEDSLLNWCDVYAKRNINPRFTSLTQHKIIPFGLNSACHSRRSRIAAMTAIANTLPRASKARLGEIYRYLATPHWKAFEHRPDQGVDDTILFQTRVWDPQDAPGDEMVNEQRISLLRTLKREFGHRLIGGVVPNPFARQYFSDLITDQPCRHPQYIRWAKRPLIGIYFRGLFGSLAFKMAEFLSASKCIVSEPIYNELVSPLDHISVYRSNDECLAACERLLTDKSLADAQRQQSWNYYQQYVDPQAHMADLLSRARQHFQK